MHFLPFHKGILISKNDSWVDLLQSIGYVFCDYLFCNYFECAGCFANVGL